MVGARHRATARRILRVRQGEFDVNEKHESGSNQTGMADDSDFFCTGHSVADGWQR